jgi:hypothetical protein
MAALWNFSRQFSLSSVMHELYFLPLIDHLPMGQTVVGGELLIYENNQMVSCSALVRSSVSKSRYDSSGY